MTDLSTGIYELLVTEWLEGQLQNADGTGVTQIEDLRNAEAADRIALYLASVVERAIEQNPEDKRAEMGVQIARRLIELIASGERSALLRSSQLSEPPRVLHAVNPRLPDGSPRKVSRPLIPLLDTTLLTNAPGEPRVGHQIQTEIASADRIDVVMAFIRRSGITPLLEPLRRHTSEGKALRILTTTYTGSTEADAIEALLGLGGQVRVSYDTSGTRLHAKAWIFHRDSGFSTAYVGSSNLTHSAQVTGLEWNVRVSEARNRAVIEKIAAVFESYWQQDDFAPFEVERFRAAAQSSASGLSVVLSPVEIRLEPFQERLLEQIELARQLGQHRNLLVSATGTGKTVMAAVDYARLKARLPTARLLFVAHREEILAQSRATFAHALRDGNFGELWVGRERPREFDHVFASIQALSANGLEAIDPRHFDIVIIDEFHHAAANSYERLLQHLQPKELLGLTATPERSDGLPILHWFEGRIAAELRLWDAIDQHRLVPFSYFGIADNLDLRDVPWRRGAGYDATRVTDLITSTDVWANAVARQFADRLGSSVRALGFCVSVEHAHYMARVFNDVGITSRAVSADTSDSDRRAALNDLAAGRLNVVFSVDLFNEGVDVPSVDALLMLRPTDSALLFVQQLGRGLRKSPGKSICTVLDFVGQHRREFRYDRRFQALLGGSRQSVARHVAEGFPFLPAGCSMQLDRVATERVLESIRYAVPTRWNDKVDELRRLNSERQGISLPAFLAESGLALEDVYASNRSWSDLRAAAGMELAVNGRHEASVRRAIGRLLHVDDIERLSKWARWVSETSPPDLATLGIAERRLLRMLLVQLFKNPEDVASLSDGSTLLWAHPNVRAELNELFDVLVARIAHVPIPLSPALANVPLAVWA